MKTRKKSRLVIPLTIGMVLLSSIPVLAYQDSEILLFEQQLSLKEALPIGSNQTIIFKESANAVSDIQDFVYDKQFTDANGHVYEIIPSDNNAKINCQHTYVDGEYENHTKNKDGSCVTKKWNAKRCSKCGAFVLGSFISETKYANCPH